MTEREASRRQRVELQVTDHAEGPQLHEELGSWARYCVARIEAELGTVGHWLVRLSAVRHGFMVVITLQDPEVEVRAQGLDGALAIWDAMCDVEQRLRELRARPLP